VLLGLGGCGWSNPYPNIVAVCGRYLYVPSPAGALGSASALRALSSTWESQPEEVAILSDSKPLRVWGVITLTSSPTGMTLTLPVESLKSVDLSAAAEWLLDRQHEGSSVTVSYGLSWATGDVASSE